jgi:hypothetical protein
MAPIIQGRAILVHRLIRFVCSNLTRACIRQRSVLLCDFKCVDVDWSVKESCISTYVFIKIFALNTVNILKLILHYNP